VPRYKRLLLKLSGEVLAGSAGFGLDVRRVHELAREVAELPRRGVETAIVLGGGNFLRGISAAAREMDRVTADHMGMLATVINALAFQDALERQGVPARVMSAIEMRQVAEPFARRAALQHLEAGRVVLLAGGTSNPFFSTDTAAALRALEIGAELLAKGTRVDGVYDKDPLCFADAVFYPEISYLEVLSRGLGVMDATAVSMCRDNGLPVRVFNLNVPGNILRVAEGEAVGSLIR
jgi:uridylate kinase